MDDTPLEGGLLFTCKLKTDTNFLGRYYHCQRLLIHIVGRLRVIFPLKITLTLEIVANMDLSRAALEAQRKEGARKKKVCFTVDDQVQCLTFVLLTMMIKD